MTQGVDTAERRSWFETQCRERGLALTIQRRAVFEELDGRRDHPTADQIFEALKGRLAGLSRTTIYRVLDTLVAAGLARRVHHPDAVARFDPMTERHHHMVCDGCGRMHDVEDASLPPLSLPAADAAGFHVHDYSISFTGLCPDCQPS